VFFFSSKRKKNIDKKINAKKGRNLPVFSRFYIWDEALFLPPPLHMPSFSSLVFQVLSKLYATQAQELSQTLEME
jgi:hypothetical protein